MMVATGVLLSVLAGTAPDVLGQALFPDTSAEEREQFRLPDFVGRLVERLNVPERASGWYVIPTMTLSEEYDSNVFGRETNRRSDFITRISPGIGVGYFSARTTALASYTLDSELYASNSDLSDLTAGQAVALGLRHDVSSRLHVDFDGAFRESNGTGDVLAQTGVPAVETGRQEVSVLSVSPSMQYQFTPSMSLDARYSFVRSEVTGDGSADTTVDISHEPSLRLAYRLTAVDRVTLAYRFGYFDSDGDSSLSQSVRLGYLTQFTRGTLFGLEAGPRFSEDGTDVDVNVQLAHRFALATVFLGYSRGQRIVVGRSGPQTTDTVGASLVADVGRALRVGAGAAVSLDSADGESGDTETLRLDLTADASYAVNDWVTLRLAYRYSREENSEVIPRHVVTLSMAVRYPFPF